MAAFRGDMPSRTRTQAARAIVTLRIASPSPVLEAAASCSASGIRGAMATVLDRHGSAPGTEGQKLYLAAVEIKRPTAETLSGTQIETLHLLMESEAAAERDRLGKFIPWLASIGSVSPLIGLLGTVLGVIDAFVGIAAKGSGNIGAVAPGVAEALIATAAALSVAIPAVFAYNIFAARLNRIEGELDSFGSELIALMVREGMI